MVKLWKHQQAAVDFVSEREATLLHMGLGTGKSLCAIAAAQRMKSRTVLILCPKSVCEAWAKQFRLFGPEFQYVVLTKQSVKAKAQSARAALNSATAQAKPCAVIVNYESARLAPLNKWLESVGFDLLVLDEVHRIKSPRGATSKWVYKLSRTCSRRVGLTGTPMPHSPLDVFAQMRSLDPSLFGYSFVRFRSQYAVMGGWGGKQVTGYQNLDALRRRMSAVTFQADRSVLDLPEAQHERVMVDLGPKASRIYKDMERDFCAKVLDGEITATNALVQLLRLQQITGGRGAVETEHGIKEVQIDHAKQDALVDLFQALDPKEPVVVFGRFSQDLQIVHQAAAIVGRQSAELSGRRHELTEWQLGTGPPILAVQIQAGGTGIDLTRAAYCIYLSTGFSLGDYEQSLARIHRPGQKRTCFYYHVLATGTVDERVFKALRERRNVVEQVLDNIYKGEPYEHGAGSPDGGPHPAEA